MPEIKERYWKIVSSKYDELFHSRTHADVTSGTIFVCDHASQHSSGERDGSHKASFILIGSWW